MEVENKWDQQQAVAEDEPGMFVVATNPRFSSSRQLLLKGAGLSAEGSCGFILQLDSRITANIWNDLLLCVFYAKQQLPVCADGGV